MPLYTRGQNRDKLTFVKANAILLYGFYTKDLDAIASVSAADLTALGHMDATAAAAVASGIRVIGANSPKPPRVSKKIANATINTQASVSTFCGFDAIAAAGGAGFKLIKPAQKANLVGLNSSRRSMTAIATLSNSLLYCFSMNAADFTQYGAALGLKSAGDITTDTERRKLIFGSNSSRPGRATLATENGDFTSFFSTASEEALGAAGWAITKGEVLYDVVAPF